MITAAATPNPRLYPPPPPSSPPTAAVPQHPSRLLDAINRRQLLTALSVSTSISSPLAPLAGARGLLQMPPFRLSNRYYLVRAGESEYESLGVINTNPVAKTSVDNGLSEKGKKQTVKAAFELKAMGACNNGCWIWPSITQRAYQAAEIIASVNGISRSYIVPEYSFLDARGLGAYEGRKLEAISEVYESDAISPRNKPPPIDDGTPNESVSDVFVRVTQLMSILETQYSEDTIIIVSPDSDNLTILQAGLVGIDLRRHSDLAFRPGEVRMVDTTSIPAYKQPASALYNTQRIVGWENGLLQLSTELRIKRIAKQKFLYLMRMKPAKHGADALDPEHHSFCMVGNKFFRKIGPIERRKDCLSYMDSPLPSVCQIPICNRASSLVN